MNISPSDIKTLAAQVADRIAGSLPAADTPRWLHLEQAAAYAGMGVKRIKAAAADPSSGIVGFPDPDDGRGTWIFDRLSLDAYRQGQALAAAGQHRRVADNIKALFKSI